MIMSENLAKVRAVLGEKYDIESLIAKGGMGDIYLGIHRALDRRVAIKIIHQELSKDELFRKRFCREAKLAASLDHPVIIDIYDFGSKGDFDYIIMPYIEGSTLQEKLGRKKRLGLPECLRLMVVLTDALSYAHQNNVVHRDIKPSNIMIDNQGHIILTDFGISKGLGNGDVTAPHTILGSPKYMSPEQIKGEDVDARSDLYSLGIVFYEMITSKHPFDNKDAISLFYCHLHEVPERPEVCVPDIPDMLCDMIMKLLEKSPERRYQSGRELLKDLETCRSTLSAYSGTDMDATWAETGLMGKETRSIGRSTKPLSPQQGFQSTADGLFKGTEPLTKRRKVDTRIVAILGVSLILVVGVLWLILHKSSPQPDETTATEPSFDSMVKRVLALGQEKEADFLQVTADKSIYSIGDSISYRFRSEKPCYLVVLNLTPGGDLVQLFPNKFSTSQFVQARKDYMIPEHTANIALKVTGPAGEEKIVALAAEAPFELLSATFEGQPFFQVNKKDLELLGKISKNIQTAQRLSLAQKRSSYSIIN